MVKITKPNARKAYNSGKTVYLLPCKMRVDTMWMKPFAINKADADADETLFDRRVNAYEYYNCNSELGYYCAYYVDDNN